MTPMPPRWADRILRACLKPADVESVSGDLLEEYRQSILPARGRSRADAWYVRQVAGVLMRSAGVWGALLAVAFLGRAIVDWFVPLPLLGEVGPQLHGWKAIILNPLVSLQARAAVSTFVFAGLVLSTGLWASFRSRSMLAGTLAGVAATSISAVVCVAGAALLLAIWHDAATMGAIADTGGLSEVFTLPFLAILPGALLGTVGGMVGAVVGRWRSV